MKQFHKAFKELNSKRASLYFSLHVSLCEHTSEPLLLPLSYYYTQISEQIGQEAQSFHFALLGPLCDVCWLLETVSEKEDDNDWTPAGYRPETWIVMPILSLINN